MRGGEERRGSKARRGPMEEDMHEGSPPLTVPEEGCKACTVRNSWPECMKRRGEAGREETTPTGEGKGIQSTLNTLNTVTSL